MDVAGPPLLGRGVVVAGAAPPDPWVGAPVVRVDEAALADPAAVVGQLHAAWAGRAPVVVDLHVDPARFRDPSSHGGAPWSYDPGFEPWSDRLHFLVWANNYDARSGEPIWWWGRKARRLGGGPPPDAGGGDVTLPDGTAAWVDGGPPDDVHPADLGGPALVRAEAVESGRLEAVPPWRGPEAALAPDQLDAVSHTGGPARVIAPAGSGKTRVLTERLRHLLADRGHDRRSVVAVAYNRKAQEEMAARTEGLGARIQTLNALGYDLIARHAGRRPTVLDEREVRRRLERHLPKLSHRLNTDPMAPYLEALSVVRLGLRDPDEVEIESDAPGLAAAVEPYRDGLRRDAVLDFDEQIVHAVELLLSDGAFRRAEQARHRHLLVDEFQDLTPAHVLLVRLLAAPGFDVFGVGDDDQVIYGHAGASPQFLVGFTRYFPGAAEHALEVNYRCPPAVVDAARTLLSYNEVRVPKQIRAARAGRVDLSALEVRTHRPREAAAAVVETVRAAVAHTGDAAQVALLTRTNSLLLVPTVGLTHAGIPVASVLRPDVLERVGLRAALAWLRAAVDPEGLGPDDLAEISRRPSRGFPRWVDKWLGRCRSADDVARAAQRIDDVRVAQRFDDLAVDLRAVAARATGGATTRSLLTHIRDVIGLGSAMELLDGRPGAESSSHLDDLEALLGVADLEPDPSAFERFLRRTLGAPRSEAGVTLSTVHRVKGREWPSVVVYGATAGLFPHRLAEDVEEERRVFHVAITRGIGRVVVLGDEERPSPFLDELHVPASERPPRPAPPVRPVPPLGGVAKRRGAAPAAEDLEPAAAARFEALREWRGAMARQQGGPAYTIFHDATLREIATKDPSDLRALRGIGGVGPTKLENYGEDVLEVLARLRGVGAS